MIDIHANNSAKDALVDAVISGGSAVVVLMSATAIGVVRADPIGFAYVSVAGFFGAFLFSLQAARKREVPRAP